MKRIIVLLALLLMQFAAIAQNTPGEYLIQLPELPDSFCQQTPEEIMKWADGLSPIRNRMQELLTEEKYAREETVAKGEPDMTLFDPTAEAAREKLRLTAGMNRMTYASYSFKTKYGVWMENLLAFTEELALVFDDVPGTGSIDGELR